MLGYAKAFVLREFFYVAVRWENEELWLYFWFSECKVNNYSLPLQIFLKELYTDNLGYGTKGLQFQSYKNAKKKGDFL